MYIIFVRESRYTTKQKGKKRMRRNWKKSFMWHFDRFYDCNGGTSCGSGVDQ